MAEEKKENTENQVDNETKESKAETVENEKAEESSVTMYCVSRMLQQRLGLQMLLPMVAGPWMYIRQKASFMMVTRPTLSSWMISIRFPIAATIPRI